MRTARSQMSVRDNKTRVPNIQHRAEAWQAALGTATSIRETPHSGVTFFPRCCRKRGVRKGWMEKRPKFKQGVPTWREERYTGRDRPPWPSWCRLLTEALPYLGLLSPRLSCWLRGACECSPNPFDSPLSGVGRPGIFFSSRRSIDRLWCTFAEIRKPTIKAFNVAPVRLHEVQDLQQILPTSGGTSLSPRWSSSDS